MMISNKSNAKSPVSLQCDQYIIYDMLGKQVSNHQLSIDNTSEKINTNNLNAGIYQIVLLSENRIIQHLTLSVVK